MKNKLTPYVLKILSDTPSYYCNSIRVDNSFKINRETLKALKKSIYLLPEKTKITLDEKLIENINNCHNKDPENLILTEKDVKK